MNILNDIVDFLFPRYCLICNSRLSIGEKNICFLCLSSLPRTNAHLSKENPIEKLYWTRLPIERATSFFFYDSIESRETIYHIKYFNDPKMGEMVAKAMAEEIKESGFFDGMDLIVPIPLHPRRLRKRGYNQCDYIAKGISEETGIPIGKDIVRRIVDNSSQTHLLEMERKENVVGIFQLVHPEKVRGKHILLIDDVITTGATSISCGQELAKAGNVKISVVSMAYAGKKFLSYENRQY
ncbi:MAG: ComF family protein [Bacteroidaceae bacterium]|nr:ComF family protein [Bacteroidaceae bacterium]